MIKSVKAKEFLDKPSGDWLWVSQHKQKAIEAVEIAEQEMINKAVEAFKRLCSFRKYEGANPTKYCQHPSTYGYYCNSECVHVKEFINKLNS